MAKLLLAQVLKRKKLSKRQFAKRLGKPYDSVWRYFRPGANPTLKTMAAWAKAIPCRIRDLIQD